MVWGNCGKTLSEKLQKLQNRAVRILTSSSYDADARYLLQQLGWKNLIAQRQIQLGLMVFKALNDLVPDYLSSMFTERSTSGYVLRDSANKLNVPFPRSNYQQKSFSYRGATLWNSLPCSLRQVKSLNYFKKLLNDHLRCRDGAVVRALASHQCGPGSIPRLGVICGLSLLVLYSALRGFVRVLQFPLSSKTNI